MTSSYTVRPVSFEDFPHIFPWFSLITWPTAKVEGSAPMFGLVALDGEQRLACAFLFTTGTSSGFIEWTGINPEADKKRAVEALEKIIEALKHSALSSNILSLTFYTQNQRLASRFEQNGFSKQEGFFKCQWTAPTG